MPCFELFEKAALEARAAVIGDAPLRLGIEAGTRQGWDAIIGSAGAFVGMTSFGASGPYKALYQHFGITPEKVAQTAVAALEKA